MPVTGRHKTTQRFGHWRRIAQQSFAIVRDFADAEAFRSGLDTHTTVPAVDYD
ncbi:MAG: hypothetical protein ACI9YO_003252 [Gammaproteobacteria bacterium]|jgi:hypothetical protein